MNPLDERDFKHEDVYAGGVIDHQLPIIDGVVPKLTMMDQDPFADCPCYDAARLMKAWWVDKGQPEPDLSPRFLVILSKERDNYDSQGTYPRIPMGIAVNIGCCTQALLPDDRTLSWEEYSNPKAITPQMMQEALKYKIPGYVTVGSDLNSLREALTQYKRVGITIPMGDFSTDLLKPPLNTVAPQNVGYHRITLYGDVPSAQEHIDLICNQWGSFWGNKGFGAFYNSSFNGKIFDVMAFTEVPQILLDKIGKMNYIKKGSYGPDVKTLQESLNTFGYNLKVDSSFGPATDSAIRDFQTKHSLKSDGIVGPATIAKLSVPNHSSDPDAFLEAVIQVESGGDDSAIGDKGNAFGCLQMWQGVVDEANARLGTTYKAHDTLGNRSLSVLIWNTYFSLHPEMVTDRDKAFCWNGGAGWRQRYGKPEWKRYSNNLDIYYSKVQNYL